MQWMNTLRRAERLHQKGHLNTSPQTVEIKNMTSKVAYFDGAIFDRYGEPLNLGGSVRISAEEGRRMSIGSQIRVSFQGIDLTRQQSLWVLCDS